MRLLKVYLLLFCICSCGCSRAFYRKQADSQTYEILDQKTEDPRWWLPRINIKPDPRSRFYDPENPDCPPLPPGDPAARLIMDCTSGIRGAKLWRRLPQSNFIENPDWTYFFEEPLDGGQGQLPSIENLTLAQSVDLSLIQSREYQTQLENLYLAALNLTFERYRFQVRPLGFFGEPGSGIFYEHQPDGASNLRLGTTHLGISRLFPAGAQFIAEFVNDTLWLFSGPNGSTSASTLSFSLVQPLMRGAWREVVLEDLTQSERNVLYAVRNFARFRKQFFVATITGGQVAGLQRFLRGFEFLAGGSSAPSIGFYPVLLQLQQLRNRQYIVRTLVYIIDDLIAAGADELDIASLKSTLADTRGDLFRDERVYFDRLDQYKVQLGLPPDMTVTLSDTLLEPFEFVDPTLLQLEDGLRALGRRARDPQQDQQKIRDDFGAFMVDAMEASKMVLSDLSALVDDLPAYLEGLTEDEQEELKGILEEESIRLKDARNQVSELIKQLSEIEEQQPADDKRDQPTIGELIRKSLVAIRQLSVVQTIVRVEMIPVNPYNADMAGAVDAAVANRLDLMNRRAQVVDARRNIEVFADLLEAEVNLIGDAAVRTKPLLDDGNPDNGNRPLDFRAKESEFAVGLQFDTPLDRVAERNEFRASQIAYEQARRGYVGAEDNIKLEVRQSVRTLEQLTNSLLERQRRVQYSARELDLAEQTTDESRRALSINNALRSLNRAQDELIEVWLDYEATRLNLYRDMGTMQIDDRGFWVDPFYQRLANESQSPESK